MPTTDQAAAADPSTARRSSFTFVDVTSQAPVLDLTGEHIKTKEDIEAAFHTLCLCPEEEEEQKSDGRKERRASKPK